MSDKGQDCLPAALGLRWFSAALQQQLGHLEVGHSAALSLTAPLAVLLPRQSMPARTTTKTVVRTVHVTSRPPQI